MPERAIQTIVVIDMGGTNVRLGHVVRAFEPQAADANSLAANLEPNPMSTRYATEDLRQADDPLEWLEQVIRDYTTRETLNPDALVIGVPFTPDKTMNTSVSSPNIPNLEGTPIASGLTERLGYTVRLERDINLLLLGEWQAGAARGVSTVFGMFVGTGVGGCYLENGLPFRGSTGAALELGHIPVRAEGRRCVCGNLDCLEAYACGHVLKALADAANVPVANVFTQQDPVLQDQLDMFVYDLACALSTSINLFHAEVALVGGGIPEMAGFPKDYFSEVFYSHLRRPIPAETVRLVWAELGSVAALHGAPLCL
ncbi:MAG: ROK family protein [Deinococcota bacterium]